VCVPALVNHSQWLLQSQGRLIPMIALPGNAFIHARTAV